MSRPSSPRDIRQLEADQSARLENALRDAFVSAEDFRSWLNGQIIYGRKLGAMVPPGSLEGMASEVVSIANARGFAGTLALNAYQHRPGNPELRTLVDELRTLVEQLGLVETAPAPEETVPPLPELPDACECDLETVSNKLLVALQGASSTRIVVVAIRESDPLFLNILARRFTRYFDPPTELPQAILLGTGAGSSPEAVLRLSQYRQQFAASNLICIIVATGASLTVLRSFGRSVFDQLRQHPTCWLVIVVGCARDSRFPRGWTVLPTPEVTLPDVIRWTNELCSRLSWSKALAEPWARCIQAEASDQSGRQNLGRLYQALEHHLAQARRDPQGLLSQIEKLRPSP